MLCATLFVSPVPLLVSYASEDAGPTIVVALMYIVQLPILASVSRYRFQGKRKRLWRNPNSASISSGIGANRLPVVLQLWLATKWRYRLAALLFGLDGLLFTYSLILIEPAVATIIFEFWPVIFVVVLLLSSQSKDNINPQLGNNTETIILMILGSLAIFLVIISEQDTIEIANFYDFGIGLAFLSSLATALIVVVRMSGSKPQNLRDQELISWAKQSINNQALISVALYIIPKFGIGLCLLLFSILRGSLSSGGIFSALLAGLAGIVLAVGIILFDTALHLSNSVDESHNRSGAITSLSYGVPVLALGWLGLFSRLQVARVDLLIVGALGVIVVNMIMHLDPEGAKERTLGATGGHGYRAIVLSLWICGVIVTFREDWMPAVWVQSSVVEYWGIVGVCATVFVLIMSFRQSRLSERRMRMDEMTLRLHAKVAELGQLGCLESAGVIAKHLRELDIEPRPARISQIYLKIHKLIRPQLLDAQHTDENRYGKLSTLMADINVFTNLRQQGRNFAELAVMTLFAGLTVLLALFVRPVGNTVPFAGFVNDFVNMVLAAAFVFLVFDLRDKRREADAPLLQEADLIESIDSTDVFHNWHLALRGRADPTLDRRISSLLGLCVIAIFMIVLYSKWLIM